MEWKILSLQIQTFVFLISDVNTWVLTTRLEIPSRCKINHQSNYSYIFVRLKNVNFTIGLIVTLKIKIVHKPNQQRTRKTLRTEKNFQIQLRSFIQKGRLFNVFPKGLRFIKCKLIKMTIPLTGRISHHQSHQSSDRLKGPSLIRLFRFWKRKQNTTHN